MTLLSLTGYTCASAIGLGTKDTWHAISNSLDGLTRCDFDGANLDTYIGRVGALDEYTLSRGLREYNCRNNRLAALTLDTDFFSKKVADAVAKYGANRIAVVVGTTSSGIQEAEFAFVDRANENRPLPKGFKFETTQAHSSLADFVAAALGLNGPTYTVSTACSSSAKVVADAHQLISAGFVDAAVVGGVDTLCWMSLCGFNSLQLLSAKPCRPNDRDRDGISIGEAGGFALLEKPSIDSEICILGYGESSDAYHMSSPDPDGNGAAVAMGAALSQADLDPGEIAYINLHGTGSKANDRSEDLAIKTIFGSGQACSSTKGWTGHALGAAGILEIVLTAEALANNLKPANKNIENVDPDLSLSVLTENRPMEGNYALTNSFGFGGNNCSLVLGKT